MGQVTFRANPKDLLSAVNEDRERASRDAYLSGMVIGIELALLDPLKARQIADEAHTSQGNAHGQAWGTSPQYERDVLRAKAQEIALEIIDAR